MQNRNNTQNECNKNPGIWISTAVTIFPPLQHCLSPSFPYCRGDFHPPTGGVIPCGEWVKRGTESHVAHLQTSSPLLGECWEPEGGEGECTKIDIHPLLNINNWITTGQRPCRWCLTGSKLRSCCTQSQHCGRLQFVIQFACAVLWVIWWVLFYSIAWR